MSPDKPQNPKPHPAVPAALTLWVALTMAVTVKTFVSPERHTVYPKMAARAVAWWSGHDLYAQYGELGRFPYSPTFAIALTPLAVLGNRAGAVLWSWISIAVYVWGVRRLVRDVLPGSWPAPREAVLLMLAMLGAVRGLWNAQSNALIIGLVMLAASALIRRRWWQAACLLGGPVFIKLWALAFAMLSAAMAPRKLAPRLVAVLAAGAALPLLTQHWSVVADQYASWLTFLSRMSGELLRNYRDLWTLLRMGGIEVPAGLFRLVQVAVAAAALAWCLRLRQRRVPLRRLLTVMLSLGAAWTLVLGPAVEYNTYVVLAPLISWALMESYETGRGRALATIAFLMTMVLGIGNVERMLLSFSSIALAVMPAGTLLFVAWIIFYGSGSGSKSEVDASPEMLNEPAAV